MLGVVPIAVVLTLGACGITGFGGDGSREIGVLLAAWSEGSLEARSITPGASCEESRMQAGGHLRSRRVNGSTSVALLGQKVDLRG